MSHSDPRTTEEFSIEFAGPATEQHEISAVGLAQSLLALDTLARRSALAVYGSGSDIDVKVRAGSRGSYIMDLIIQSAPIEGTSITAVSMIKGLISLCRWARGKEIIRENTSAQDGSIIVKNIHGDSNNINLAIFNLYGKSGTQAQLSRLTQMLDKDGFDHVAIIDSTGEPEVVSRAERPYFRREEGIVLTDSETEVLLEVVVVPLNGSSRGWRFYEGEGGVEFTAEVTDEDFLASVKDGRYSFSNGTTILATLRTVQRRVARTITERSIIEVRAVYQAGEV